MVAKSREMWLEMLERDKNFAKYDECIKEVLNGYGYYSWMRGRKEAYERVLDGFIAESEKACLDTARRIQALGGGKLPRNSHQKVLRGERMDKQGRIRRPEDGYQPD
jgi:hypothetical protein